jgi:exopolysaccharide production protein ExoY
VAVHMGRLNGTLEVTGHDVPLTAPVMWASTERAPGWRGKRCFDVVVSLVLIVLLAPVMLLAMVAVRLTSPGPVFFRQSRVGRGGKDFWILKFRTMLEDAEERLLADQDLYGRYLEGSHKLPCHLDPRLTKVGRFFRVWSIDELPQLFNVLAGDMSLVGPRPVRRSELADYGNHLDSYLSVKPGLTGLWQVSGRSRIHFPARAELDARYRVACGAWTDLRILLKTPLAVLLRLGSD